MGRRPDGLRESLPGLRRALRHFAPHLRGQRHLIAGGSASTFAEVALRLAEPWPLALVIDGVLSAQGASTLPAWLAGWSPQTLVAVAAIAVVAVVGLRAGASYLATVAFALAGNRVLTRVRADLFDHLQRLSLRYHATTRTGDLVTRLTGDVGRLQEVAVTAALPLATNAVTFVAMVVVMLVLDAGLTVAILAIFPLLFVSMQRGASRIQTVSRRQRRVEGDLASRAAEGLSGIAFVQAYGMEDQLRTCFADSNERSLHEGVQGKRLSAGLERRTDLLVGIGTGLVLLLGARAVLSGQLSVGALTVFLAYLKNAFKPMRDIAKYTGRLAKAGASGERIVDILEQQPDVADRTGARVLTAARGYLELQGVTFRYGDEVVLDGLDLVVRPGERVALVGPSGGGKSTIGRLLLRLWDPDSGVVSIDGHDVRDLTVASVRGSIATVQQESVLFAGTIREAIAHGRPGASDEDVVAAARLANAHDFISSLSDGYDTAVAERGATLSGGQRQRIAIARAVLRDAPVVLLDEPTAGLDDPNAAAVTAALEQLCQDRTMVLITHDLRQARTCDRVVWIEGGRVIEQGAPDVLLASPSHFAWHWSSRNARVSRG